MPFNELKKAYEPKETDKKWYSFWNDNGFFEADTESDKKPFSIVMPPPNVTGRLHVGHALVSTLQDVLVRWKRMSGFETLWVPGTDHAGIATQTVVERHLFEETGKRRADFDRKTFVDHVFSWKEKYEKQIVEQIQKIGCSCDWERLCFTLDEKSNRAVKHMFKKLYDDGLIYQGDYLVNWDTITKTALSDDEVDYEEKESFLWYFTYPVTGSDKQITIATTRPETMLGDTAIAVSPEDKRYQDLVGKTVTLPIKNREIPIITDWHVDPKFGTGAVKVTPAHDPNDYQMGIDHDLPFINIMTPEGKLNEEGGQYEGLTMEEAREKVVEEMKKLGHLVKIEPHTHRIGRSYRSKAIIQPYLSKQWFIKMEPFKSKLKKAVEEGKVRLIPKQWETTYHHWIDNLRDWCISRQLWWGHRIPIWHHKEDPERKLCVVSDMLPKEITDNPDQWEQESDVLDTWFSSALWPLSVMGWPNDTEDFKTFFPTSALVTGWDILFFWVAKMVMMAEYATGEVPFTEVYLHGLIFGKSYWREDETGAIAYCNEEEKTSWDRGEKIPKNVHSRWEKMSKSKGNVVDVLTMIDEFGTDAVRMALTTCNASSRQIDLDVRKFEEFKHFANKLWNGARFVLMALESDENPFSEEIFLEGINFSMLSLEDQWILNALNNTVDCVNYHNDEFQFDQAATTAYEFFWNSFCAWYVEIAKPVLYGKGGKKDTRREKLKILFITLEHVLRLLHPFAPFITEELFQEMKKGLPLSKTLTKDADPFTKSTYESLQKEALIIAPYPQKVAESRLQRESFTEFAQLQEALYAIRNMRGEMQISPSTPITLNVVSPNTTPLSEAIQNHQHIISALTRVDKIHITKKEMDFPVASTTPLNDLKIIIPLPEEMVGKEIMRLEKELEKTKREMDRLNGQLANHDFIEKAPAQLVEKIRMQHTAAIHNEQTLSQKLEMLKT